MTKKCSKYIKKFAISTIFMVLYNTHMSYKILFENQLKKFDIILAKGRKR